MPPTFDVKLPPLSEATTQKTYARYKRLATAYDWLWFPWAGVSLFVGYEVFNLFLAESDVLELIKPILGIMAGVLTALVLMTSVSKYGLYVRKVYQTFSPLAPSKCQEALTLAKNHPDLESYRLAVVSERQFTLGDLEAMQSYVAQKAKLDAEKEVEDKHQAACEALHRAA